MGRVTIGALIGGGAAHLQSGRLQCHAGGGDATLPLVRAATSRHAGRCPRFINEYKLSTSSSAMLQPCSPSLLHVSRSCSLACRVFLKVIPLVQLMP